MNSKEFHLNSWTCPLRCFDVKIVTYKSFFRKKRETNLSNVKYFDTVNFIVFHGCRVWRFLISHSGEVYSPRLYHGHAQQASKVYCNKMRKLEVDKQGRIYTATPVACGWAGAVFEVTWSLEQEQWCRRPQKPKKSKVWRTDGPTDGTTDQQSGK